MEARKMKLLGRGSKGYMYDWVALDHSAAPAERGGGKEDKERELSRKWQELPHKTASFASSAERPASSFELSLHSLSCFPSITFLFLDKQSLLLFKNTFDDPVP